MTAVFEIFSWLAMISLTSASVPQIIMIFKRKSTEGISWPTYGLLLFGMSILFVRSLLTIEDLIIQLNYGISAFIITIANLQFVYYRVKKQCTEKNYNN